MVGRLTLNQAMVGSTPPPATMFPLRSIGRTLGSEPGNWSSNL